MKKVGIIGAGIGGIATAIRLAVKGYKVEVFESNSYVGGKLSEIRLGNYRFDAGPSLFTMPQFVEELFLLAGKDVKQYFTYEKLDTICKYYYEDGTILEAYADKERFAKEMEEKLGEPQQKVLSYLKNSAKKYDITANLFLKRSLHKWHTWLNRDAFKGYLNLHHLGIFRTMNQYNEKYFTDKRAIQLFNRYATYNGSDPYQTPATLTIIPHLEYNIGAFFPKGGMYAITKSLAKLAEDIGVKFHLQTKVEEIITEKNVVKGLQVGGEMLPFEVIVSNVDMVATYKYLLPKAHQPEKLLSQPKSSSALIFYWGIAKEFPELRVHNIFFSKDYQKEFEHIFIHQNLSEDPTIYINIASKGEPTDAPKNAETWFVMINTPNNTGQDWDKLIAEARKNILSKLKRLLETDIESLIEVEDILDARKIELKTTSSQGALYGNSSNNKYAAFLRHPNFSREFANLYFVGGSVHPGGGIPLCLSSAAITADLIKP
ncbi:MAG: 1-hydroxycarotenoid 3,4-desaturase CrtD [Thermonemataceae bacterium]|nr:1-hydroxycarotenoid 3,4-desaturase CrtD [Thermonemataceae bacterium]